MTKAKTVSTKVVRMSAWERVLEVLMTGQPVEKKVFDDMFGETSYKISAYILYCKNEQTKAVIRANKDGRKVKSYQLMNPQDVMQYWAKRGITIKSVNTLSDLKATPVEAETVAPVVETEKV